VDDAHTPRSGATEGTAPAPARGPGLVISAVGGLGRLVDTHDRVFIAGLAMLLAGLWRWFHLGVALTVAGALLLAVVFVAAARQPAPASEAPARGEGG
jgi:hypothetical protein